ncbi:unnamed protein product [Cuscuta epithymum]|uniref:AB hydrolase-1 domain-containing protein n=1 Tax=Cuscuta epithymum TaxID=186058 RepID=A0AAV0EG76_9ASTE|nr:unnamed protein product [Cuscuta epithymum]
MSITYLQSAFSQFPSKLSGKGRSPELILFGKNQELLFTSKEQFLNIPPQAATTSSAANSEQMFEARRKLRRHIAGIDQDELLEPALLADPDSFFCEFNGVEIHHKICDAEESNMSAEERRTKLPIILLHGFGASVFSWNRVMKPLARISGTKVLAFDRPAFGLTSRSSLIVNSSPESGDDRALNPYSMAFSVHATLHFIEFLTVDKAILMGHSAGSLVAVEAYFEAPERVAALILVAPAIFAPFTSPKQGRNGRKSHTENGNSDSSRNKKNVFGKIFTILSKFTKYVAQAISGIVKGTGKIMNSLYRKALAALLRSAVGLLLVRMIIDKFGVAAVRNSWYDPKQVTDHILQGYTKPLRVKGWDVALVEHTLAMFTDSKLVSKPPLSERLSEISCPVLIITGDRDRLVPAWNSERLSRAIPGACYEIIKNSGHLPHEEKVEEFISIVDRFLHRVLGGVEQPHIQAVT